MASQQSPETRIKRATKPELVAFVVRGKHFKKGVGRLREIADKCPVKRTLDSEVLIETRPAPK
jgi:uncharacterized OsmC-like protein